MNDLILDVLLGVPFAVWALICGVACFGIVLGVGYLMREEDRREADRWAALEKRPYDWARDGEATG